MSDNVIVGWKNCPICEKGDMLEPTPEEQFVRLDKENDGACIKITCWRCGLSLYDHNHKIHDYRERMNMLAEKWNGMPRWVRVAPIKEAEQDEH